MRRPPVSLLRTVAAAAILGAAALGTRQAPDNVLGIMGLVVCSLCGSVVAVMAGAGQPERRFHWWLLAAVLGLQSLVAGALLPWHQPDYDDWVNQQLARAHHQLDVAAEQAEFRQTALLEFTERALTTLPLEALIAADPFDLCRTWLDAWQANQGHYTSDSLAVILWRGAERIGWAGPVVPTAQTKGNGLPRVFHDGQWWVLVERFTLAGTDPLRLECQLRLASVTLQEGTPWDPHVVHSEVVSGAGPLGRRSWGDAQRGLRVIHDMDIGPPEALGVQLRFRLSMQIPSHSMLENHRLSKLAAVRILVLGLASLVWGAAAAGFLGFWSCAWLARWFWVETDLMRRLALLLSPLPHSVAPSHPASLLDPAYFATTYGGGWLASGADALLSALLVAGTARWLWRRLCPKTVAVFTPRLLWYLALWLPVCVWLMYGLWNLWQELAINANARLIGLQVPFEAWSFWALHAVILLLSLSVGLVLLLLAVRLAGGVPAHLRSTARPYLLAAGLLLVVLFNYAALSHAYSRLERDWLARKAEEVIQPQDDWIGFLLEDVLGEMAIQDAVEPDPAAAGGGSGSLRRSRPAYQLWQRSAVRDLGLPALVEVFDQDGVRASLFATGFLRDTQFEVVDVGPWQSLVHGPGESQQPQGVLLQTELRRYPTGREKILRGEIQRRAERGWLRLELPVQSWRVATLAGDHAAKMDHRSQGYRPRQEVERSLLLMLGDDNGWLDAGFGALPDVAAERAIASLRTGAAEWAVIHLDGSRWLCRWAPLPAGPETRSTEGFLIGLERQGLVDILLDGGRLLLLNVSMLGCWFLLTTLTLRRRRWQPGFQGRFLLGYLVIGMVLLVVAGNLADRQAFQRVDQEARTRAHDGLVTALGQLHGLLTEQARALASSEYLNELLIGRLGSERPVGSQTLRQSMVFGPGGELLLDETLSDLDPHEVHMLLAALREGPIVVMTQREGLYLGVMTPLDLSSLFDAPHNNGTLFYRQRIDDQLLPALAEVIGGEMTLRLDGEVVEASHPGRVLSGENPILLTPNIMDSYRRRPSQPMLQAESQGLAFTGGVALPALSIAVGEGLKRLALPAVLTVEFPARERDYTAQRRRMALFLAGLITLLLLTALGLAMVMTWNIFEPLRVLLSATQRLAAGDYSAPLPPASSDEVGRLALGFQTMRDRLHEAQAVLAARERFLQAVLDQVPVGVVVWEGGGRLAAWNPSSADILERFYPELPAGYGPAVWAERLRRDVRDKLPPEGGALTSDDGARTLRVGLAPLELGGDTPHELLVCEDLTEFLAAKKLALNAEMARQVAHEIKNPLTPIQLSAQLLLQAYQDGHPQLDSIVTDAVQRIVEQVELLRSIAGEFSLLGRPNRLSCEPLELDDLVHKVVAQYRGVAAAGPRVIVADDRLPAVLGHRESLVKVLSNLMQNSIDAVEAPVDLELSISWRVDPKTVSLIWTDNGTGISTDVAPRLFNPYFSTKSKGTGLGLAICRNLLGMMGGTISLANCEDCCGTTATVTLLRADAARHAEASPDGTSASLDR